METFCNPLNLEYKFQHLKSGAPVHREAADPTLIYFKGKYYLFASMSGGFWHSDDLIHWQYHEDREIDIYFYAPDVAQVGEYMVFAASRLSMPSKIRRSKDPLHESFEKLSAPFPFWDPHTYCDDDGRVYFYWGCSNITPLYGVEMNPNTMKPMGKKQALYKNRVDKCGWERVAPGAPNAQAEKEKAPYIEGAFMTKHNGKYYLQYAAPGTELLAYGDGVYVSDNPLGPYQVQAHNPFSTKPGGFITGAGHSSTITDEYGNMWHASSMRISVNASFERRLGLFPCGIDADGIMYCNQNFADYPYHIPDGKFDPWAISPQWMLLSYKKSATASSSKKGHQPELGVDESIQTCWCADSADSGQWYQLDLEKDYDIRAIQLNFADEAVPRQSLKGKKMQGEISQKRYIDLDSTLKTQYVLQVSSDGVTWATVADKSNAQTNLCHDYLVFENGITARYVRVIGHAFPYHSAMAISGLRVFGLSTGEKPEKAIPSAIRVGGMDAKITWSHAKGAQGYNVRYGIAEDKLYSSWMVYDANHLDLPFLDADQPQYFICVDAFNENGITPGDVSPIT